MKKILVSALLTALLLTACAAPQGKTTVISDSIVSPKPTEFVLGFPTPLSPQEYLDSIEPVQEVNEVKKETPTAQVVSVVDLQESSVSPTLVSHMVANDLPEQTAKEYASYIVKSSEEFDVDPITVLAVMHVETGGTFKFSDRPNSHGAIGLMQILKRNVACNKNNSCTSDLWEGYTEKSLYDPETNIELGTKYLKYLQDRFGNDLGITAYNQGEGNVSKGTYNLKYFKLVQKALKAINSQ